MQNINLEPANSVRFYNSFWLYFKLLGITSSTVKVSPLGLYDVSVNVLFIIYYPIHVTIGLLADQSQADFVKIFIVNITCIVAAAKHYLLRAKMAKIRQMIKLFEELDKRIESADELKYFNSGVRVDAERIIKMFVVMYSMTHASAVLGALITGTPMYPAWFPIDWRASAYNYWFIFVYQFLGASVIIILNLSNDTFPALSLRLVSGHVRILSIRLAKIGHDATRSQREDHEELLACIEDHSRLVKAFYLMQDTISYAQLTQFLSSGLLIGIVVIYLMFFTDSIYNSLYYIVYSAAMAIEIFPACYYGSLLQKEFNDLPNAIFQCNWIVQPKAFRKNMSIFMELTLKRLVPVTGGIIQVNLGAFVSTYRMAYSLIAVIMRMK